MLKKQYISQAKELLKITTPLLDKKLLYKFVDTFLTDSDKYLKAFETKGSPLYVIDHGAIINKAVQFRDTFLSVLPQAKFFYALKSNNHPFLIETVVKNGYGIDVSSGQELQQALLSNPNALIFSGPAKTQDELMLAVTHSEKVIVLVDNFSELERLENVAKEKNKKIRVGVRLMIEEKGLWRKFGIALNRLPEFFEKAQKYSHIDLCGLQFHSSWNLNPAKQKAFLIRLGKVLSKLDKKFVKKISFIDIGGGYWPEYGEWMQPSATPEGKLKQCLDPRLTEGMDHRCLPAVPIKKFAIQAAQSIAKHVLCYVDCDIFLEPGRFISHDSMHILLQVIDKKAEDVVITDGGTNIVGWERFEMDYFPVINLTRPALKEVPCMVFGSLCTPHDIWGYSYFGSNIQEGDVLLIPTQGAYTYSLRQNFIKPLAREYIIKK